MSFRIFKKKNSNKITVTYEAEFDIKDLEDSAISTMIGYYKVSLMDTLRDKAIDQWIEKHGKELFDKFDTEEFMKEYKKEFMKRLLHD